MKSAVKCLFLLRTNPEVTAINKDRNPFRAAQLEMASGGEPSEAVNTRLRA
jgi:hypothetical protein